METQPQSELENIKKRLNKLQDEAEKLKQQYNEEQYLISLEAYELNKILERWK